MHPRLQWLPLKFILEFIPRPEGPCFTLADFMFRCHRSKWVDSFCSKDFHPPGLASVKISKSILNRSLFLPWNICQPWADFTLLSFWKDDDDGEFGEEEGKKTWYLTEQKRATLLRAKIAKKSRIFSRNILYWFSEGKVSIARPGELT